MTPLFCDGSYPLVSSPLTRLLVLLLRHGCVSWLLAAQWADAVLRALEREYRAQLRWEEEHKAAATAAALAAEAELYERMEGRRAVDDPTGAVENAPATTGQGEEAPTPTPVGAAVTPLCPHPRERERWEGESWVGATVTPTSPTPPSPPQPRSTRSTHDAVRMLVASVATWAGLLCAAAALLTARRRAASLTPAEGRPFSVTAAADVDDGALAVPAVDDAAATALAAAPARATAAPGAAHVHVPSLHAEIDGLLLRIEAALHGADSEDSDADEEDDATEGGDEGEYECSEEDGDDRAAAAVPVTTDAEVRALQSLTRGAMNLYSP